MNCRQNSIEKKQTSIHKPIQYFFSYRIEGRSLVEYDIDTLANFNQVTKILEETDCLREYAVFNIEGIDTIYKIQPLQICESIFDYKLKEILYINSDSITVNYDLKFPVDSLKTALKNHLFNPTRDQIYPSNEDKKMISIKVDNTKSIIVTKVLLLNIIEELNKLKNKPSFVFMFEDRGILPKLEEY